jgi:rfaE bifunctional protein kinase chain/domain
LIVKIVDLISKLSTSTVLVYGDFVLDEFLRGGIDRISREAPVFIISHEESEFRPGCAANAAANVAALGATVQVCGIIGNDSYGQSLVESLEGYNIDVSGLLKDEHIQTAVKTRVIAGGKHSVRQQIVRIDRLRGAAADEKSDAEIRRHLKERLEKTDAVLISDYGVGSLRLEPALWLLKEARSQGKPVMVDSRYRLHEFKGATAMTPNQPEAERLAGTSLIDLETLHEAGGKLLAKLDVDALVITRGGEGMSLFQPGSDVVDIDAYGDEEVVDVTGAGDTVIATYSLATAVGASPEEAARLANVAGGLTVLKKGTNTVSREEILHALDNNPIDQ